MDIAYYPGCSLHSMAKEYDISTQLVCQRLGINLHEVPDWNCCGATAAHSLDHKLSIGLSGRNLSLVDGMALKKVTTPCAGCFSRLKTASNELKYDSMSAEIEKLTGVPLAGAREVEVAHFLQLIIEDIGLENVKAQVVKPLQGMKVACYSGCLLTRPRSITHFDDSEQPMALDYVLEALGAEPLKWSHKAECCGGGFAASETSIVVDLGGQVLEAAQQAGAEVIVAACPMCQANLDTRQIAIEQEKGKKYNLPIIYFTQLIGLAFGIPVNKLGFKRLLTSPFGVLSPKGLV